MLPNRIIAVYTPLGFAPLAGFIAAWLAAHIPGVDIAQDNLWAVFVVGMLVALTMAAQWVYGWQKYEARSADQENLVLQLSATEGMRLPVPAPQSDLADADLFDDDLDDFDDLEFEPTPTEVHGGDRPAD